MILNENTGAHAYHQPDRRVRLPKKPPEASGVASKDCPGHIEGKFAWMRARVARAAKKKRDERRKTSAA